MENILKQLDEILKLIETINNHLKEVQNEQSTSNIIS